MPYSSGLHSVDRTVDFAERLKFLDDESAKPAVRWARRRSFERLELGPGRTILEVGCGAGDDARAIAGLVAPDGRVVAIDVEPMMIAEAERRSARAGGSVEFRIGDVYALDYSDEAFHGSRAERMFLHLSQPERAVCEMTRVVRRGGKVVVVERDIETRTIDAPDRAATRKIVNFWCDQFLGGWVGRQLPRLFREAGLHDIEIDPVTVVDTDLATFDAQYDLSRIAARAIAGGAVTAAEGAEWLDSIRRHAAAGSFFASMTNFIVSGRRG
jgi:ubiquinone/menaquinone biosynthesis C-methylase UbiE